jgi:hypothetical protein
MMIRPYKPRDSARSALLLSLYLYCYLIYLIYATEVFICAEGPQLHRDFFLVGRPAAVGRPLTTH